MRTRNTILAAALCATLTINATPYKNLYVAAEVYPAGAGEVYVTATPDGLVTRETGYGETSEAWLTIGENGQDATQHIGAFEAMFHAKASAGNKFIGFVKAPKESGEYAEEDFLTAFEGNTEHTRIYVLADTPDAKINVNNPDRPQDGHSDNNDNLQSVAARNNWAETPDFRAYAVFESRAKNVISAEKEVPATKDDIVSVTFSLANRNDITALQFDIVTTVGVKVNKDEDERYEVAFCGRESDQTLKAERTGNAVRLLAYSLTNSAISGTEGDLMTVRFAITRNSDALTANISNIMLTDRFGHEFACPSFAIRFPSSANGISQPLQVTLNEEPARAYDLSGRPTKQKDDQRGILIIDGRKILK